MKPVKSTVPAPSVRPHTAGNQFHLIPGQFEYFCVCVDSSRNPSSVDSTGEASSSIDLGPNSARSGCLEDKDLAGSASVQDKIRALDKTVVLLQAQREVPRSTTPKLSVFNTIVELVKETLSPEICVTMDSPQKKGRGDYVRLYDTPQETVS